MCSSKPNGELRNRKWPSLILAFSMALGLTLLLSHCTHPQILVIDPPVDAGMPPTTMSEADFCDQVKLAPCAQDVACGVYSSDAGCSFDLGKIDRCAMGLAAVKDGRATFDGKLALQCIKFDTQNAHCAPVVNRPDCEKVFAGNVPTGNECFADFECANNGVCSGSASVCGGVCVAGYPAGVDAERDSQCAKGLYLRLGKCTPFAPVGSSCVPPVGIFAEVQCAPGSGCSAAGICVALKPLGAACVADTDVCYSPVDKSGTCLNGHCVVRKQLAQACDNTLACARDLFCGPDSGSGHFCGTKGVGTPCDTSDQCTRQYFCDVDSPPPFGSAGTCQLRRTAGMPCFANEHCRDDVYCDWNTNRCVPTFALGDACVSALQCGVFQTFNGLSASVSKTCLMDHCAYSTCVDPTR